jgi:hypothetical protein
MMVLAGVTPMVGIVTAAVPVPHNMWGHPLDETGVQMPVGELITSWIDGVEYGRNDSFLFGVNVWFDINTDGNWVWAPGNPNSPWIREGGDIDDPIMYAWGDMTNIKTDPDADTVLEYGIFFESDLWLTTEVVRQNLNLSALVEQPTHFPKISWIVPEPNDPWDDYVLIYTEDPSFLMNQYYLEKNDGSLLGPTQSLTGISNSTAYFYANLTNPLMDLNGCGDELKLVWTNPGTAFGGRDIVVDRVEWNATVGGCHGPEPDNTIMTDATAPASGFAIRRTGTSPVFADDTNDNAADFVPWPAWGRPIIGAPTVIWNSPVLGDDWTGGMDHAIQFTASDDNALNFQLDFWMNYSLLDGIPGTWLDVAITDQDPQPFPGFGSAVVPMDIIWTAPCVNTTVMKLNATAVNPSRKKVDSHSEAFEIDCERPSVLGTDPFDTEPDVPINRVITITFSELMNTSSVMYTIEGGAATGLVDVWPTNDVLQINHNDLDPGTKYWVNITAACDDSLPTGNCMAAVHSFSFTTYLVTPPTILVTVPVGSEVWTRGSPHDIEFIANHTPGLALVNIWLNYSCTVASGAITSGIGTILTTPYTWVLPTPATDEVCTVDAEIKDMDDGLMDNHSSGTFTIDVTDPTAAQTTPAMTVDVPVDTDIVVTFSERLKTGTVVFTLEETGTGTGVTGTEVWSIGEDVLTFTPDGLLLGSTEYTVTVDMAAEDISLPGNTLVADHVFTFTTETTNTDPTITLTTPTATTLWAGGGSGLITWTMSDAESEDANLTIDVSYIYSSATTVIVNDLAGASNHTWTPVACPAGVGIDALGVQIFVEVEDEGGLMGNDTSAAFTIDCTDPTGIIAWTGEEKEGETITFRIDGGSSDISTYDWSFGDLGSGTGATPTHSYDDGGTYTVTCILTDAAGNTGTATASIDIESVAPPPNILEDYWWIILIIIIVVIVAILALAMRKKPKEEEEEVPYEEEEEEYEEEPEEEELEEEVYEEEEPEIEEEAAPAEPEPEPEPSAPEPSPEAAAPVAAAAPAAEEAAPAEEAPAGETKECPSCGTVVPGDASECFLCGATL